MTFPASFGGQSLTRRLAHGAAMTALLLGGGSLAACGQATSAADTSSQAATNAAPAGPPTITVSEWKVDTAATVAAGSTTFQIKNGGTVQHELLVFKSDLAPSAYPMDDSGNINEDDPSITKLSDGDNLDPGTTQSRTVDLSQPGTYLFVCNLPGHFKMGMYKVVTVK